MAKQIETYIKLVVKGAQATPAPPIGPALGPKGVNSAEFCKQFNARTKDQAGELFPVVITVYSDKSFDFILKTPPTSALIMKEAKIEKGSKEPNRTKVGKITWEQIKKIATIKMPDLNAFTTEAAMSMVAGTAKNMGVTIEGKNPLEK